MPEAISTACAALSAPSPGYPDLWHAEVKSTIVSQGLFLYSLFIFSPQVINKHPFSNTLDIWNMVFLSSETMISF